MALFHINKRNLNFKEDVWKILKNVHIILCSFHHRTKNVKLYNIWYLVQEKVAHKKSGNELWSTSSVKSF